MRATVAQRRRLFQRVAIYIAVLFIVCISAFPFYMMLLSAFSSGYLQATFPPLTYLKEITLENFRLIVGPQYMNFLVLLKNSLIVSSSSALIATVIGILGGFSVARLRFPGRRLASQLLLLVYLLVGVVLVIPLFKILLGLKLINTHPGLVLSYLSLTVPLALYLSMSYFRSLSPSVEEAAFLDGCSYFSLVRHIIVPISMPLVVTVFVIVFIVSCNEYFFALVFIKSSSLYTIPVGIQRFWVNVIGGEFWGLLNAAAASTSVIMIFVYGMAQRFIVKGLTAGAEKG